MYIDLIIFLVLLILVLIFYKRRKLMGVVFYVAIFDLVLRILTFLRNNIPNKNISNMISRYIPSGVLDMIYKYTQEPLSKIFAWIFIVVMSAFLYFIIKIFIKKKKI